eukprot:984694_1
MSGVVDYIIPDSEVHGLHIRYFSQLTLYQVMLIVQIALIIATVVKFHQKAKLKKLSEEEERTNNRIKFLFVSVMATGTVVFILVEWYGIADFLYDFAAWSNYCNIAAILGNLSILTYLLSLYLFYLYRLRATFNKSAIQLTPFTVKLLLTITFGIYFIMIILIFTFQKGLTVQTAFSWNMKKSDYKDIIICAGEFSIGIDARLRWALQTIVIVGNIFYGWIFYRKLYELLKFIQEQTEKKIAVDPHSQGIIKLMNKQTTLVLVSTVSTTILWSVCNILELFDSYWQILVYFEISVNCLCLFLMFAWNDKLYKRLCHPCIFINRIFCSQCFKSETLKQIEKEIELNSSKTKSDKDKNALHFHTYYDEDTGTTRTRKPNENEVNQN